MATATQKLIKALEFERVTAIAEVARGAPADYEKYRERVGYIKALDYALKQAEACHHELYRTEEDQPA